MAERAAAPGRPPRVLVFLTDAFGGRGGIAQFNSDMLRALAAHEGLGQVTALPRLVVDAAPAVPHGVAYGTHAAGGKGRYLRAAARAAWDGEYDAVVCSHLNLLPVAASVARLRGCPLWLVIYGIEAWQPRTRATRALLRQVSRVVSISEYTLRRFQAWAGSAIPATIVPCGVDLRSFAPGPRPTALAQRYGVTDRRVLLTVARLDATERYKGIDEIMGVLPALAAREPDVTYLIVGDGTDRARLQRRAAELGVDDRVVFAGYVAPEEKLDHYRLAHAFAMPGRCEGFGIVYLEALACGLPVVASSLDASREAVRDGELGAIVNPDDADALLRALREALARGNRGILPGLDYFDVLQFERRWHALVDEHLLGVAAPEGGARPALATAWGGGA